MVVRGAPAIGIVAAYGLALEALREVTQPDRPWGAGRSTGGARSVTGPFPLATRPLTPQLSVIEGEGEARTRAVGHVTVTNSVEGTVEGGIEGTLEE